MPDTGEPTWIEMVVDHLQLPFLVSMRSVAVRDAKGTWRTVTRAINRKRGEFGTETELQINVGNKQLRYITLYGMNPVCLVQMDAT